MHAGCHRALPQLLVKPTNMGFVPLLQGRKGAISQNDMRAGCAVTRRSFLGGVCVPRCPAQQTGKSVTRRPLARHSASAKHDAG